MKIRYEMETPWPTDVEVPAGIDGIDWIKHGEIPFLPTVGMHIDNGDGDLRQLLEVYWCADAPDEVAVFFQDDTARKLTYWQGGGWQSSDLPKPPARKRKAATVGGPSA